MMAISEKMKMEIKKSHSILFSSTKFLKKILPLPNFSETLSSSFKKGVRGGRKLMYFHLKIYVILLNSIFCSCWMFFEYFYCWEP